MKYNTRLAAVAFLATAIIILASVPARAEDYSSVRVAPNSDVSYNLDPGWEELEDETYDILVTLNSGPSVTVYVSRGEMTREGDGTYNGDVEEKRVITTPGDKLDFTYTIPSDGEYFLTVVNPNATTDAFVDISIDGSPSEETTMMIMLLCVVLPITVVVIVIAVGVWWYMRSKKKKKEQQASYAPPPAYGAPPPAYGSPPPPGQYPRPPGYGGPPPGGQYPPP